MTDGTDSINCTILTLRSENVMLPSSSIAEIISVNNPTILEDVPDWYLGKMEWHGVELPLVSFEAVKGAEVKNINLNTQVAVLYTPDSDCVFPYIGLIVSGVPHATHFSRDQISVDQEATGDEDMHPMVAFKSRINGAAVSILDIDGIESMIKEVDSTV